MKKISVIMIWALFVISCGSNEFSDPGKVAENFLKNYITMNYADAKKYCAEEFQSTLDFYETDKVIIPEEQLKEYQQATATIKDIQVDEKNGTAKVKFINDQNPDIIDELELKKNDEKWLVSNVERTAEILLEEKFSEEEVRDLMKDEENIPEEAVPIINEEQGE